MYKNYLNENNPVVTIKVKDFGTIKLELFESVAPNTVANFIEYALENFYDGLIFHRIIKGFMIQGGGGKPAACTIYGEFKSNGQDNPLKHTRGVISMARTMDKNSATSQFFIMHQDAPHLDGQYAGFGGMIEGFDVLDAIANVPTGALDKPLDDVVIESLTVDTKGKSYQRKRT